MSLSFESIIEELEAKGGMEPVIAALLKKQSELGPGASEEEITDGIREVLLSFADGVSSSSSSSSSDTRVSDIHVSDEDRASLVAAAVEVEKVFKNKGWKYSKTELRADIVKFELGFSMKDCNVKMRVYVETDPNVCRVDAILPITADPIYEYPLCKLLMKENYARRYGAFQYDESDGEITYRYSFSTQCGLFPEVFEKAFLAVANAADNCFLKIRKCAVGKFSSKDAQDIRRKVNDLINDIDE